MRDVHIVHRYTFCSTNGIADCQVVEADMKYLTPNSFKDYDECINTCTGFSYMKVKPCNATDN